MMKIREVLACVAFLTLAGGGFTVVAAQGVTTGAVRATVKDASGNPRPDVRISALHAPSGTRYEGSTRADGRALIPGMRVGGPYRVTASAIGYERQVRDSVYVRLGEATDLDFVTRPVAVQLGEVTITATNESIISSARTGAATQVSREALATLPTINGRLESIVRLTPQSSGGMSFAGQDSRLNNITVDGSYFNNSFGLGNTPGDRTGVAPISLNAIEAVQVNIAPYDVRQGNFVGAAVNSVTRSGTNEFSGSLYYQRRNQSLVGTKAGSLDFNPGTFNFGNLGGYVSGPIIKDKLFFFFNYEDEALTEPGTTFRANTGAQTAGGSITRVKAADLDALSAFMQSKFNYVTGPYQDYDHRTPALRKLAKFDYNVNDRNKLTFRYNQLDSKTDVLVSNSTSLGFGNRRSSTTTGLNYQNSNYQILENNKSAVGEWNAMLRSNMSNNMIVGYSTSDESRDSRGSFFPFIDILESGSVYTSLGFEPFTPNNELRYNTLQFQNNLTRSGDKHDITVGVSAERFRSENVFFQGAQSVYTYNSLADFYADANDYIANPTRTTSPITLRRFQVGYSNIPGLDKPLQPMEVVFGGVYAQDEWRTTDRLKMTFGLRVDAPYFKNTAFVNTQVDGLNFMDENGATVKYSTSKMPGANMLYSPRVGFNWNAMGDRTTQVRGGSGVFTGRPAYVWISNQIGNNGVLTGFDQQDNTKARPFSPDPNRYKPATVTGAPAASYALAFTDPNFKFPQLWRSNFGVDQKLPMGFIGTLEYIYDRDVNGVYYINANQAKANTNFTGADTRPRWTTSNRINANITSAVVLKNQDVGSAWNLAASLEKPFSSGLFVKAAYAYGKSKNTVDPGSIAFGTWNGNPHSGNPNLPGIGIGGASAGHRAFATTSYRAEWFKFGATTVSLFAEARTLGNTSYTYSGDLNGDGGTGNDLLYIPKDVSEMNFQTFTNAGTTTVPARTFTAAEQAAAWETYISQDDYLSANRGTYAQRGAVFLPLVKRMDLSFAQELFTNIQGKRNSLQVRADVLNFGNLLNKNWGLGQRITNTQPLVVPTAAQGGPADAAGKAQYRLRVINNELQTKTYEQTAGFGDVWRIQLGLRYSFN